MVGGLTSPSVLNLEDHQGTFGEHFVDAIAAVAGVTIWTANRDREGVDRTLGFPGPHGTKRYPLIGIQVKTWSTPRAVGPVWRYPMETKHYNKLAGRAFSVPRFLILVIVPGEYAQWAQASPEALLLRHAAYWTCLHEEPRVLDPPPNGSRTVSVPQANLLTPASLLGLFDDRFQAMLLP